MYSFSWLSKESCTDLASRLTETFNVYFPVWLWSSRNVLWTRKLHPTWIVSFWWVKFSFENPNISRSVRVWNKHPARERLNFFVMWAWSDSNWRWNCTKTFATHARVLGGRSRWVSLKIFCPNKNTNYTAGTDKTFPQLTHLQARLLCRWGGNDVTTICASSQHNSRTK